MQVFSTTLYFLLKDAHCNWNVDPCSHHPTPFSSKGEEFRYPQEEAPKEHILRACKHMLSSCPKGTIQNTWNHIFSFVWTGCSQSLHWRPSCQCRDSTCLVQHSDEVIRQVGKQYNQFDLPISAEHSESRTTLIKLGNAYSKWVMCYFDLPLRAQDHGI